MTKKSDVQEFDEELTDPKGKKAGNVTFSVKYIWAEPDAPLVKRDDSLKPLNKKCKLVINIIDASFLKNADTFGDQDPYVKFKYGRGTFETTVKYKAGKYAKWNEKFELTNVKRWVENEEKLELEAMEKDVGSSDFLGSNKPIELQELCDWEGVYKHDKELLDEKKKVIGRIKFSTQFVWVDYVQQIPNEKLDEKTMFKIVIDDASFLKDGETFGK